MGKSFKGFSKALSLILAVAMVVTMVPTSAYGAELLTADESADLLISNDNVAEEASDALVNDASASEEKSSSLIDTQDASAPLDDADENTAGKEEFENDKTADTVDVTFGYKSNQNTSKAYVNDPAHPADKDSALATDNGDYETNYTFIVMPLAGYQLKANASDLVEAYYVTDYTQTPPAGTVAAVTGDYSAKDVKDGSGAKEITISKAFMKKAYDYKDTASASDGTGKIVVTVKDAAAVAKKIPITLTGDVDSTKISNLNATYGSAATFTGNTAGTLMALNNYTPNGVGVESVKVYAGGKEIASSTGTNWTFTAGTNSLTLTAANVVNKGLDSGITVEIKAKTEYTISADENLDGVVNFNFVTGGKPAYASTGTYAFTATPTSTGRKITKVTYTVGEGTTKYVATAGGSYGAGDTGTYSIPCNKINGNLVVYAETQESVNATGANATIKKTDGTTNLDGTFVNSKEELQFIVAAAKGYEITKVAYKVGSGEETTLTVGSDNATYTIEAGKIDDTVTVTVTAASQTGAIVVKQSDDSSTGSSIKDGANGDGDTILTETDYESASASDKNKMKLAVSGKEYFFKVSVAASKKIKEVTYVDETVGTSVAATPVGSAGAYKTGKVYGPIVIKVTDEAYVEYAVTKPTNAKVSVTVDGEAMGSSVNVEKDKTFTFTVEPIDANRTTIKGVYYNNGSSDIKKGEGAGTYTIPVTAATQLKVTSETKPIKDTDFTLDWTTTTSGGAWSDSEGEIWASGTKYAPYRVAETEKATIVATVTPTGGAAFATGDVTTTWSTGSGKETVIKATKSDNITATVEGIAVSDADSLKFEMKKATGTTPDIDTVIYTGELPINVTELYDVGFASGDEIDSVLADGSTATNLIATIKNAATGATISETPIKTTGELTDNATPNVLANWKLSTDNVTNVNRFVTVADGTNAAAKAKGTAIAATGLKGGEPVNLECTVSKYAGTSAADKKVVYTTTLEKTIYVRKTAATDYLLVPTVTVTDGQTLLDPTNVTTKLENYTTGLHEAKVAYNVYQKMAAFTYTRGTTTQKNIDDAIKAGTLADLTDSTSFTFKQIVPGSSPVEEATFFDKVDDGKNGYTIDAKTVGTSKMVVEALVNGVTLKQGATNCANTNADLSFEVVRKLAKQNIEIVTTDATQKVKDDDENDTDEQVQIQLSETYLKKLVSDLNNVSVLEVATGTKDSKVGYRILGQTTGTKFVLPTESDIANIASLNKKQSLLAWVINSKYYAPGATVDVNADVAGSGSQAVAVWGPKYQVEGIYRLNADGELDTKVTTSTTKKGAEFKVDARVQEQTIKSDATGLEWTDVEDAAVVWTAYDTETIGGTPELTAITLSDLQSSNTIKVASVDGVDTKSFSVKAKYTNNSVDYELAAWANFTVENTLPVYTVDLSSLPDTMEVGQEITFAATVKVDGVAKAAHSYNAKEQFIWTSTGNKITATLDKTATDKNIAYLAGASAGTTTLSVVYKDENGIASTAATKEITVNPRTVTISLTDKEGNVTTEMPEAPIGGTGTFYVKAMKGTEPMTSGGTWSYASADTKIVQNGDDTLFSGSGVVTAGLKGVAAFSDEDNLGTTSIVVKYAVGGVTYASEPITVKNYIAATLTNWDTDNSSSASQNITISKSGIEQLDADGKAKTTVTLPIYKEYLNEDGDEYTIPASVLSAYTAAYNKTDATWTCLGWFKSTDGTKKVITSYDGDPTSAAPTFVTKMAAAVISGIAPSEKIVVLDNKNIAEKELDFNVEPADSGASVSVVPDEGGFFNMTSTTGTATAATTKGITATQGTKSEAGARTDKFFVKAVANRAGKTTLHLIANDDGEKEETITLIVKGLDTVNGKTRYFDEQGNMAKKAKVTLSGVDYYFDADGYRVTDGPCEIEGGIVVLKGGIKLTGLVPVTFDGVTDTYYVDPTTGFIASNVVATISATEKYVIDEKGKIKKATIASGDTYGLVDCGNNSYLVDSTGKILTKAAFEAIGSDVVVVNGLEYIVGDNDVASLAKPYYYTSHKFAWTWNATTTKPDVTIDVVYTAEDGTTKEEKGIVITDLTGGEIVNNRQTFTAKYTAKYGDKGSTEAKVLTESKNYNITDGTTKEYTYKSHGFTWAKELGSAAKPTVTATVTYKVVEDGKKVPDETINTAVTVSDAVVDGKFKKFTATLTTFDGLTKEETKKYNAETGHFGGDGIEVVGLEEEYDYTGKPIKPAFTVVDNVLDKVLVEGTDYSVSYKDNKKVGTATITIKGKNNYGEKDGVITKQFKIVDPVAEEKPEDYFTVKSVKVASKDGFTYDGTEKYPKTLTIKTSEGDVTAEWDGSSYGLNVDSTKELKIVVTDNIKKGSGVVAVYGNNGKGAFVTKTATFSIKPCDLSTVSAEDLTITPDAVAWAVKGATPAVEVSYKGDVLVEGSDYTLSWKYTNRKNAGENAGEVTVKGKNNFTKKASAVKFNIDALDLNDVKFTVAAYDGVKAKAVKVVAYDQAGVVIPAKQYKVKIEKDGKDITTSKDALKSGDEITVTLEPATTNLDGSATANITVAANLAKVKVVVPKTFTKTYTGQPIELTSEDFESGKISVGSLEFGTDFEVVAYQNNVKKGTMTAYIQGVSDKCSGTGKIKVKIVPQKVKEDK